MNLILESNPTVNPVWKDHVNTLEQERFQFPNDAHSNTLFSKAYLKKWSDFSKTIEVPKKIGQFNSNDHYISTLKLVLNSTYETSNRILFFQEKILPTLKNKDVLLDVGAGDGSVTLEVAHHFEHLTAIDPNDRALTSLESLLPIFINFTKINKDILHVKLEPHTYDLVILSHVLYYICPKFRLNLIESAYKALRKDGKLVIVLGGDELGKANLIDYFGGENLEIDPLALKCRNNFGFANTSLYASNESFVTSSKEAMFHISSFMLADAQISSTKEHLNHYIESNLQCSENYYVLTSRQKYIVINK